MEVRGQISINLSRDNFTEKCLVQLQRRSPVPRSPVPILLGTDLQSKLGFMFVKRDSESGNAIDLLSQQEVPIIALPIQNHSFTPINLEESQLLGHVKMDTISLPLQDQNNQDEDSQQVNFVNTCKHREGRSDEILQMLGIKGCNNLSPGEMTQLTGIIENFADIFALDESELGLVQHSINTGEYPPIKQPPRRIPFAL